MGSAPDLSGVYLKLDRARTHIDAIRDKTLAFTEREPRPFDFRVQERAVDGNAGAVEYTLYAVVREQPPADFGPMIGDAVHNIRSALDHLVYELSPASVRDSVNTQFPIFKTEADYRRRGEPKIKGITGPERTLIERVQPWYATPERPESDVLAILNRLSNRDKHRLLVPVIAAIDLTKSWVTSSHAEIELGPVELGPVAHDAKLLSWTARPTGDGPMTVQPRSGLRIALSQADARVDWDLSLVEMLGVLHGYVAQDVIDMWFKYGALPPERPAD